MIDFDVLVKKTRSFTVYVKNVARLDSLICTIKTGTYKMSANIYEVLSQKVTLSHKTKIIISEWFDFINPRPIISNRTKINTSISSLEYFNSSYIKTLNNVQCIVSSNEYISNTLKTKLSIIADPTVGIFRKLVEFDTLTIGELDSLSLKEMEYIETATAIVVDSINEMKKL